MSHALLMFISYNLNSQYLFFFIHCFNTTWISSKHILSANSMAYPHMYNEPSYDLFANKILASLIRVREILSNCCEEIISAYFPHTNSLAHAINTKLLSVDSINNNCMGHISIVIVILIFSLLPNTSILKLKFSILKKTCKT